MQTITPNTAPLTANSIITSKLVIHQQENRIDLCFANDISSNQMVKNMAGAGWSKTLKAWHIADCEANRRLLGFNKITPKDTHCYSPASTKYVEEFIRRMRSKRYSEQTIKVYADAIMVLLKFYADKPFAEIDNNDIVRFNNEYIRKNNYSSSYQNQVVNAIKLFFTVVKNTKIDLASVHRPKREKRIPNVLSKEEVAAILNSLNNIKHKEAVSKGQLLFLFVDFNVEKGKATEAAFYERPWS